MASSFIQDHNRLFADLSAELNRDLARLSQEANGGRSILFVYPPEDEEKYIGEARRRYTDGYEFIDLREVFTEFVDSKGLDKFRRQYKNMGSEVFVSQNYTTGTFYSHLMTRLVEVAEKGVSPILVHTGVIYNMGFSNQNIMEDHNVMQFRKPLVFFYPATMRNETIYFLDKQPASKYRCVVVK
ncbi:hypothetical protein [Prevotella sp. P2-180]|uniref:hypothetical protein n=1 Tax=Prevotella sp. P2-180 TaxID=2024224 RepID=UPI000B97883B|nr:hypothetical protein [Prevotella sp. P2-180]OYP69168.1 hypothetical protein CIK98_02130 [Prevotella sp. P2-180]